MPGVGGIKYLTRLTSSAAGAQLPGDAEVVRAQLRIERKARLSPPSLPSSFASDVAEITGTIFLRAPALAEIFGTVNVLRLICAICAK